MCDGCVLLFYWLPRLLCLQGRPAGVGSWDAGTGGGREVRRGCSVGSTGDVSRSETRQQLVSVVALGRRLGLGLGEERVEKFCG